MPPEEGLMPCRVRLQSCGRRRLSNSPICKQLELQERLLDQERECVPTTRPSIYRPAILTFSHSVRQLAHGQGDQAHHQGQRDHEVSTGFAIKHFVDSVADVKQGRRHKMATEEQGRKTGA